MTFQNDHRFRFGYRKCLDMRLSWIDEQLADRGMNRRELADRIGLTEAQMSKVMSGLRRLSVDEGDAIRRAFGYTLPDDRNTPHNERIQNILSRLGDEQKLALVLYMEALAGIDSEQSQAS